MFLVYRPTESSRYRRGTFSSTTLGSASVPEKSSQNFRPSSTLSARWSKSLASHRRIVKPSRAHCATKPHTMRVLNTWPLVPFSKEIGATCNHFVLMGISTVCDVYGVSVNLITTLKHKNQRRGLFSHLFRRTSFLPLLNPYSYFTLPAVSVCTVPVRSLCTETFP